MCYFENVNYLNIYECLKTLHFFGVLFLNKYEVLCYSIYVYINILVQKYVGFFFKYFIVLTAKYVLFNMRIFKGANIKFYYY